MFKIFFIALLVAMYYFSSISYKKGFARRSEIRKVFLGALKDD